MALCQIERPWLCLVFVIRREIGQNRSVEIMGNKCQYPVMKLSSETGLKATDAEERNSGQALDLLAPVHHPTRKGRNFGGGGCKEDNARRLGLGLLEEVPDHGRVDTNEELDELGGGAGEEGHPASPETARVRRVFPVPGGTTRRHPLGILAPSAVYLSGFLRKSTTSCSSTLAWSAPVTSRKVTPVSGTS
jgi:hypothetical protein